MISTSALSLSNNLTSFVSIIYSKPKVKTYSPIPVLKDGVKYPILSSQSVMAVDLVSGVTLYEKDSNKLSAFLIDKVLVLTVPGKEFGMDGYLRLSYCGSIKDITEGIERIKWALDPNAPNELYIGDRKLVRDWL